MTKQTIRTILKALEKNLEKVSEKESENFINKIHESKKIFIVGAGRSGLVGKSFGMRLMHLGCLVYLVGDTVTPAIEEGDALLAISGSGKTSSVKVCVEAAKRNGATVILITGSSDSDLGKMADVLVRIPTMIKGAEIDDYDARQLSGIDLATITPLGTIFELSSMIFCDAIIAELMKKREISEGEMKKKHANLE
jgi:6-phospho-3-hexuloisomerase